MHIASPGTPQLRGAALVLGAVPTAYLAGRQLAESGSGSWVASGAVTLVTAILFGPVAWRLRSRATPERRERVDSLLTLVAVPVVIAAGVGPELVLAGGWGIDASLFGMTVAMTVVVLAELVAVPERFRSRPLR